MGYKKDLTYIDDDGYKHFTDSEKKVHTHVAEMKLGRKLRKGEVVHHINRNKLDNRRSNLYVFRSQKAHYKAHKRDLEKYGSW